MKAFSVALFLAFLLSSATSTQKMSAFPKMEVCTRDQVHRHRLVKARGSKIVIEVHNEKGGAMLRDEKCGPKVREEKGGPKIRQGFKFSIENIRTVAEDSDKTYVQRARKHSLVG